jgi:Holliday junction resolvase RusA-like endonuclease
MYKVNIKPLSVNQAWKGRRFKTQEYKQYEKNILMLLPALEIPEGKLSLSLVFGLSNKNADVDNPVKCFVDCMQKKYGFNDRNIYKMNIEKIDVKKGCEFIEFKAESVQQES